MDPRAAGKLAGQIGIAVIASRMLVGLALDLFFAPRIAIAISLVAAAGNLVFYFLGAEYAWLTAIAIGLALGVELDLMGFLIARYFGLARFGRSTAGCTSPSYSPSGLGPLLVARCAMSRATLSIALVASAIGLLVSCGGFLVMPRYPDPALQQR